LFRTEGSVLVAIDCIEGDERMETTRSFAVFWDHCLAILQDKKRISVCICYGSAS